MSKFNLYSLHKKFNTADSSTILIKISTRRTSSCRIDHYRPNRPNQVLVLCKRGRASSQYRRPLTCREIGFSYPACKLAQVCRGLILFLNLMCNQLNSPIVQYWPDVWLNTKFRSSTVTGTPRNFCVSIVNRAGSFFRSSVFRTSMFSRGKYFL